MASSRSVNPLSLLFIAISLAAAWGPSAFHPYLKGLLMPVLMYLLASGGHAVPRRGIIMAALGCSWLGDVLLLFEKVDAGYFIAGLSAFLTAHLLYIRYFLTIDSGQTSLLRRHPWMAALVAAYGVSLVNILWSGLGEMKLPVTLYAVVICIMIISSLHAYTRVRKAAGNLLVSGALLFAISDSLLAVNKFYSPFSFAGPAIMLTYCAAQYCIVCGVIRRAA